MSKLAARLQDAARSGVYRASEAAAIADSRAPFTHVALHGGKAEILAAIAKALQFPDWFGANWDALEDCLCDLKGGQHVLVFAGADALPADELGILVDVLDAAATFHGAHDTPFFAVFLDPQRKLALPDLYREK